MSSLLESCVTQWLPEADVDFLTGLCEEYEIEVPGEKADDTSYLLKLVLRYLNSEALEKSTDGGTAVFLKLFNELGEELGKTGLVPKSEPDVQNGGGGGGPKLPNASNPVTYHKLREFKISGTINGGKPGTLSYLSLSCQLKQAEKNYPYPEIIAAVIKALPAGASFRDLLESKDKLNKTEFTKLLRSHFKEKDSSSVLQELLNCHQKPGQDAHAFCCHAMSLRDRIKVLSEEEGAPWDPVQLRSRFYHTVFTGLKQNSIRMELQTILKEGVMGDADFLAEVSVAEANETERLGKVKVKEGGKADSNSLTEGGDTSENSDKPKSKKPLKGEGNDTEKLLAQISQISSKMDKISTENQAMKGQLKIMQEKQAARDANGNAPPNPLPPQNQRNNGNFGRGWRDYRCQTCIQNNVGYCEHCNHCGSTEHKRRNCDQLAGNA